MSKPIFSFLIISAIISSCGNTGIKESLSKTVGSESAVKVEFASLIAKPDNYIDKNIIVEGKVVHVCTQTGKKLFIVGENPDIRLYVAAGENISKFPMDLLGSEVTIEGVITKVGGSSVASNEKPGKVTEGMSATENGIKKTVSDNCETETALAGQPSLANIIMKYKSHTVK